MIEIEWSDADPVERPEADRFVMKCPVDGRFFSDRTFHQHRACFDEINAREYDETVRLAWLYR